MRNYLYHFAYVVLPICLFSILFGWWAEPLFGDLTRIGKWTEHDFGPNTEHPIIHFQSSGQSLPNHDVVVLGDSFTARNLWQSVLFDNSGYIVKSFQYGSQNCIPAWIEAAIAEPTNSIIMVETVERSFIERFSHIPSCSNRKPIPSDVPAGITTNLRPDFPPTLNPLYLLYSAINTGKLNIFPEKNFNSNGVINIPLRAECARFSNRRNDRLLYYAEDDMKQQWSAQEIRDAVANVLHIQKEVERSGKKFVFIIAPDKSSVYQTCLLRDNAIRTMPNINEILIASGVNAPNMQTTFKDKINTIVDLYDPDNTHWSEAGYILAGETISRYISGSLHGNRP